MLSDTSEKIFYFVSCVSAGDKIKYFFMKQNKEKESRISNEILKWLLTYNHENWIFIWKVNRKNKTKEWTYAWYLNKKSWYRKITICWTEYQEHRIAWFYHYWKFPVQFIDHINWIKDDNRIINLRDISQRENNRNSRKHKRLYNELPTWVYKRLRKDWTIYAYRTKWNDINWKQKVSRNFNVKKYSWEQTALESAILYRNQKIEELNSSGANYTNRHWL